jgi:hypothetical protein
MDIDKKIIKGVQASIEMELSDSGEIPIIELEILIKKKLELYLTNFVPISKRSEVNEEKVVSELVVNCFQWTPLVQVISDPKNHVNWLNEDRKKDWLYWNSYERLLSEGLDDDAISDMDDSSNKILEQLEDPKREGSWDRRGLVVGHVQSGKTGNYTAVIAKAADAGYKIIIVLAGLHNNLRSQTQLRIEEGFVGYTTGIEGVTGEIVGVGNLRDNTISPNSGTNSSEKGDFNIAKANSISGISPETKPWVFVIKKNKSVLEHLLNWITKRVADSKDEETGRKIVTKLPLLVIDDEADNASIDTKEQALGCDGVVDEEHSPTAINSLIREILHSFSRKAYIGYTATPFANVFIHNHSKTKKEGRDLFPSAFIVNLMAHSNYVGPSTIFSDEGQRLFIRDVNDFVDRKDNKQVGWIPNKHKSQHFPLYKNEDVIPPSLREAINSFFISCSVRYLRGDKNAHWSMLVHVTRFNDVQGHIVDQINKYLKLIKQKIKWGGKDEFLSELRQIWDEDFCFVTSTLLPKDDIEKYSKNRKKYYISDLPEWSEIEGVVESVINDIKVMTINGKAKDALAYKENEELGLKVIAVGGDKLSRGLTLEGLSTSYFLRASKMYDTLMQMGRWFGYRTRYFDLCRLYTTSDLTDWFSKISEANDELREEFELMANEGMKPFEFGLKVQSHPGLLITSPLKMRTATTLKLSFSGSISETVVFSNSPVDVSTNMSAFTRLLEDIDNNKIVSPRFECDNTNMNGLLYKKVNPSHVIDFLSSYVTHSDSYRANSDLLASFIGNMNKAEELTDWTVAVFSGSNKNSVVSFGGEDFFATHRSPGLGTDSYKKTIGRLLDPKHELIDVTSDQYKDALKLTQDNYKAGKTRHKNLPIVPSNSLVRFIKGKGGALSSPRPESGLLMLYLLEIRESDDKAVAGNTVPAFGISFPNSESGIKVPYAVNNVWKEWEGEFDGS